MPTDATFLLAAIIIVATAIGFAFKVYSDRDRDPPPRISADYIRGLNLVLSRKTDEALELFVQMAKVDDETLETHFALGHLFRRRGEVERAIRVHQNLLARPNLNETQRHQARLLARRGLPRRRPVRPRRAALRRARRQPDARRGRAREARLYLRAGARVAEGDRRAPQARDVERHEVQSSRALLLRARRRGARERRPRARALVLEEHDSQRDGTAARRSDPRRHWRRRSARSRRRSRSTSR